MINFRSIGLLIVCILTTPILATAKEFPVQARFTVGSTSVNPTSLNEAIAAQGLKKFDSLTQFGLEITYPLLKYLDVGARLTARLANNEEQTPDPSTDFSARIEQQSYLLVARVPFVKTDLLRVDAFAGFGGSNTVFKIKTAGQDGELTRKATEGWLATPYAAYGASVSIGHKWIYLVFEGGIETNKVDGFTRSGSVNSNIDAMDFSGPYFSVGLMLDGIPGSRQ